jgi:hypothetical protein
MMIDNVKISGFIVLFVGVGLLIFTFTNAFLLMQGVLSIPRTSGLMELFGVALAPLIESAIKVLYLGVMGWLGSILTRRGVQILTVEREEIRVKPKTPSEPEEAKAESKPVAETKENAEATSAPAQNDEASK